MRTCYFAVHKDDASWMIGERISEGKHAVRFSGYDFGSMMEIAALQNLVILKTTGSIFLKNEEGKFEPVILINNGEKK